MSIVTIKENFEKYFYLFRDGREGNGKVNIPFFDYWGIINSEDFFGKGYKAFYYGVDKESKELYPCVKIKKIKPWCIYFSMAGDEYFLHGCAELGEPDEVTLYYRKPIKDKNGEFHGNYVPIPLIKASGDSDVKDTFIRYTTKKRRIGDLNQVDIDYFVKQLVLRGFCSCEALDKYVEEVKDNNRDHEVRIKAYKEMIDELNKKISEEKRQIIYTEV